MRGGGSCVGVGFLTRSLWADDSWRNALLILLMWVTWPGVLGFLHQWFEQSGWSLVSREKNVCVDTVVCVRCTVPYCTVLYLNSVLCLFCVFGLYLWLDIFYPWAAWFSDVLASFLLLPYLPHSKNIMPVGQWFESRLRQWPFCVQVHVLVVFPSDWQELKVILNSCSFYTWLWKGDLLRVLP